MRGERLRGKERARVNEGEIMRGKERARFRRKVRKSDEEKDE